MPLAPPVIKIVLLVSFIIKYPLNYVTIYKSHSTSTRRLMVWRRAVRSVTTDVAVGDRQGQLGSGNRSVRKIGGSECCNPGVI